MQSILPAPSRTTAGDLLASLFARYAAMAWHSFAIWRPTADYYRQWATVSRRRRRIGAGPLMAAIALSITMASCTNTDEASAQQKSPGQLLYEKSGCAGCHGRDGAGVVGPALTNILGSEVSLVGGGTVVADYDYLVRSILDPGAEKVDGFSISMPRNTLTETEAQAIASFLQELE